MRTPTDKTTVFEGFWVSAKLGSRYFVEGRGRVPGGLFFLLEKNMLDNRDQAEIHR